MTVKELIFSLQELGEENLDREVIMFDGPSSYIPCKIEILDEQWGKKLVGKVLID